MRPGLDTTAPAFDPSPPRATPRAGAVERSGERAGRRDVFELPPQAPAVGPAASGRPAPKAAERRAAETRVSERRDGASHGAEPARRTDERRMDPTEPARKPLSRDEAPHSTKPGAKEKDEAPERLSHEEEAPSAEAMLVDEAVLEATGTVEPEAPAPAEAVVEEERSAEAAFEGAAIAVDASLPAVDRPEASQPQIPEPALEAATPGITFAPTPGVPALEGDPAEGAAVVQTVGVTPVSGPAAAGLLRAAAIIESREGVLPSGLEQALEKHAAPVGGPDAKPEPRPELPGLDPAPAAKSEAKSEAKTEAISAKPYEALDIKPETASLPPAAPVPSPRSEAAPQAQAPQQAPGPAAQTPVVHHVPLGAVPIEIGLKSLAGVNRFEIRLDPAELGRIDVRLEIGESGEVKAHLVVDRVETLALLQRDAKTLERAFEQAGLKPSDSGIDLSLRDPSGERRSGDQSGQERDRRPGARPEDGTGPERRETAPDPQRIVWRGSSGVDVRI